MKKSFKRLLSLFLGATMAISMIPTVFAASENDAVIDYSKTASLTLYKFDFTAAEKDGIWDSNSFVSTGVREEYVTDTLLHATRVGADTEDSALENGLTSKGYAIRGVEFSYLRVADVMTYSEVVELADGSLVNRIDDLYGFTRADAVDLMTAIGLYEGGAYVKNFEAQGSSSTPLDANKVYYTSEVLNKALYDALAKDETGVTNALETYMSKMNGSAMPLTDADGKTAVNGLKLGLYLVVETKVPEMVTNTTNPFFVSLPMTKIDGDANSSSQKNAGDVGGHFWNYDVVLYPKNETGIPTLEKTVREEAEKSTGKNEGSEDINDGYAHTATASAGDTLEWQIISTLPSITSYATALTDLHWVDTIDAGLTYGAANTVTIKIYTDKDCTNLVDTWDAASGNFTVSIAENMDASHTMTVTITDAGLKIINGYDKDNENSTDVLTYTNYSNYTVRIQYTTTVDSNNEFIYGDEGNDNLVIFTWKRTSSEYFDTLIDDAHVYSYGLDILKLFADVDNDDVDADGHGTQEMYDHVKFIVYNVTDGYWVVAQLNEDEGVYYVTGHTDKENLATQFSPVFYKTGDQDGNADEAGHIVIKGLEDDEYMITEIETYNGYSLLTDHHFVEITSVEDDTRPCDIYNGVSDRDVGTYLRGLVQNDTRYDEDSIVRDGWAAENELTNIPQKHLEHVYRTASAKVDGVDISMRTSKGDDGVVSTNALAFMSVVNHRTSDLPQTGDDTLYLFSIFGTAALVSGMCLILLPIIRRKKEEEENA